MNSWRKIICSVFGHKYRLAMIHPEFKEFKKLKCKRCAYYFAMHTGAKYLGKWDAEDQDTWDNF